MGIALIIIAGFRYAHTGRLIDRQDVVITGGRRTEMALTVLLALLATFFCIFVIFT